MKVAEVINNAAQPFVVQPSVLKQQARAGKLVNKIAASDAQQQQRRRPSAEEVHVAMSAYKDKKRQADATYAQRLRQQLERAETQRLKANTKKQIRT